MFSGVYDDNGTEKSLTITHFFTIFFFLFAGLFTSAMLFVAEKCLAKQTKIGEALTFATYPKISDVSYIRKGGSIKGSNFEY